MRKILLYLFLIHFSGLLAQSPTYIQYTVMDGLPSNLVYYIEQDNKGFLWFGTDKGLARFDGTRFRVYGMKEGLPDPEVLGLYEDREGRLWISCFYHKPCYFYNGEIITEKTDILLRKIDMKSGAYAFYEDDDHALWLTGDDRKFCRWSNENVACFDAPDHAGNNRKKMNYGATMAIRKIRRYGEDLLGFCSIGIVNIFEGGQTGFRDYLIEKELRKTERSFIHVFAGDKLLCLTNNLLVLLQYNGTRFVELERKTEQSLGGIFADRQGRFWLSRPGEGVLLFDQEKIGLADPTLFLKGKKISHVFEDKDGNLWFATLDEGVFMLPENTSVSFTSSGNPIFKSNNFTAITRMPDGRMAIGDDSRNFYYYNGREWTSRKPISTVKYDRVRQFQCSSGNSCYVITDKAIYTDEAVSVRTGHRYQDKYLEALGSPKAIFRDHEGWIWVGTSSYLFKWKDDPTQGETVKFYRTTAIGEDGEGYLWIGGLDGVYSEADGFRSNWGTQFPLLLGRITAISKAYGGSLWIVTPEHGLLLAKVNKGAIKSVEKISNKLEEPIQNIQSVYVDEAERVWLATNNGVYSLSKDLSLKHFDEKYGIANDVNAIYVEADTLWAATTAGLNRLSLSAVKKDKDFPTYISGIRYMHQSREVNLDPVYSDKDETVIPQGASMLELEFTSLQYPGKGHFSYQYIVEERFLPLQRLTWNNLKNVLLNSLFNKKDTSIVAGQNLQFGTNTPIGRFRIKVASRLSDGTYSTHPYERTLTILPKWHQTLWFYLSLPVVLGIVGWGFYRERRALKKSQRMASGLQLQAIRAQMNPHFIGNSINAIQQFFYPPDPETASQYISTFTDLLRRTMELSEVSFITMQEELAFIRDYLEMVRLRFEDRFVYEITVQEELDLNLPFPAMYLQPILENATIHGLAPEGLSLLKLNFYKSGNRIFCTIVDNGVGIKASKLRKESMPARRVSKGIELLKQKINMLNKVHGLDLKLEFIDLSDRDPDVHGTKVQFSYTPYRIPWPVLTDKEKKSRHEIHPYRPDR